MNQPAHILNLGLPSWNRKEKRPPKKWPFWVGIGLFLVAAVFIIWPRVRNSRLRRSWEPLEFPISLSNGIIATPEFRPVLNTDYYILVEVRRKIEFQRLNCLLGLEDFHYFERCENAPEAIDISWVVTSAGDTIAQGRSQNNHGGWYSDTIDRTIGHFQGGKALPCKIRATINKDASELNQTNPRLIVSVHPSVWEGDIIAQQIAFSAACLIGLSGAVSLAIAGVSKLLAWRRSRLRNP
jgi:hypothetical protein